MAYSKSHPGYKISVQSGGTNTGFRNLCKGTHALIGASRTIQPKELATCQAQGITPIELPVAHDAIALVVSRKNTWLKTLPWNELTGLYAPEASGKLLQWSQLRSGLPALPIKVAGLSNKHGTFAAFSQMMGLSGILRYDLKMLDDHSAVAQFVAADESAIGFLSLGEAINQADSVRIVGIDFGKGPVVPDLAQLSDGRYQALTRTVYLYVNPTLMAKRTPQDQGFMKLLISDADRLVRFARLAPLPAAQYKANTTKLGL